MRGDRLRPYHANAARMTDACVVRRAAGKNGDSVVRVLILTAQVPFVYGGAEVLADGLLHGIRAAGHTAEIVAIPFSDVPYTAVIDQILACSLLAVEQSSGRSVDRVIGLKFPAYCIPHPQKVLWILHQYRGALDLWGSIHGASNAPDGAMLRAAIHEADRRYLREAREIFTISHTVSRRLLHSFQMASTPLYPPLENTERYVCGPAEDYFFFPSRINFTKRQHLVVEALSRTVHPVRLRFAGSADDINYETRLREQVERLGLQQRVTWLGRISEEEKHRQLAHAVGIIFPPLDEDFGYVTVEAMLSRKPTITCLDSGGTVELVRDQETGRVVEPTPEALAAAMDDLWADRSAAREMGEAARTRYEALEMHWPPVVERLLR